MKSPVQQSDPCALVVDDDGLVRMDAVSILEDAGFQVMEADHADEAVVLLQEHYASITLLFSDVHMPGTRDGFALARYVAEHWPHISIVIASGRARPSPGDLPEGACFVSKPFSSEIVRRHLKEVMPDQQQPSGLKA